MALCTIDTDSRLLYCLSREVNTSIASFARKVVFIDTTFWYREGISFVTYRLDYVDKRGLSNCASGDASRQSSTDQFSFQSKG